MVVGSENVHSIWYFNSKKWVFFLKWLYVYCQNYSYRDFCDKKLNECCENVCTVCRNDIKRNGLLQFFFQRFDFFVPFTNWCFFVFKEIFIIYKAFMLNLYQCIQRVFLPHHTCNYLFETKLCLKRYLIRYI